VTRAFEDHCWQDIVTPEILQTYAPYQRETYIGKRPALLAVDLYNLAYAGGAEPPHRLVDRYPSSCGVHAHAALEPTRELFALARSRGIPVLYTTAETRAETQPGAVHATHRQCVASDPEVYSIKAEFQPQPGDTVIYKARASAFFATPLVAHLVRLGVDSLLLCGQSTSGCVRATCVDGHSFGYHVTIVEECVFDRSELSHKVNLFDLHHKYGDVMQLAEVREKLGQ
jgi:nicotinamidase-related amidase